MSLSPRRAILSLISSAVLAACTAQPAATPMPTRSPDPTTQPTPIASTPTPTAGTPGSQPATPSAMPEPTDPLLAVELTDVRSGEAFTLGQLAADEGPVLLEPMAIWCSSCRAQQHEVVAAHERAHFTSVSLDVDLTELPEDLAAYADREGWDWRFAMADADLYRLLEDRFGFAVTHPPSTPLIVIEADGTIRPLDFGVGIRSAEQLVDELGAG